MDMLRNLQTKNKYTFTRLAKILLSLALITTGLLTGLWHHNMIPGSLSNSVNGIPAPSSTKTAKPQTITALKSVASVTTDRITGKSILLKTASPAAFSKRGAEVAPANNPQAITSLKTVASFTTDRLTGVGIAAAGSPLDTIMSSAELTRAGKPQANTATKTVAAVTTDLLTGESIADANLPPDTTMRGAEQTLAGKPLAMTAPQSVAVLTTDRLTGRSIADATTPHNTSMSGVRVALANFMVPTAYTSNSTITSTTTRSSSSAKPLYWFRKKLKQTLFTAVDSSPFAIGFDDNARLAVWQVNRRFALVDEEHKFVIMLDPGHGGSDPGSVGHNGLQEKTLTLDIAKRAQRLLSKNKNVSVILTRNSDKGMSRQNRVYKVKRSKADMFVSLHLNHLPQTDVNLVETFYAAPRNIFESIRKQRAEENGNGVMEKASALNPDLAFTNGSKQLASIMQKRVFNEVMNNNPDTENAGVKEDTLFILTRSFTPGALIELSCLSNVKEAARLNNPAYREKLAAALANGIQDYLATPAAKRQFGPEV